MVVLWFLQNCGGGRVAIMAFGPMGYGYAMSDNLLRCDAVSFAMHERQNTMVLSHLCSFFLNKFGLYFVLCLKFN